MPNTSCQTVCPVASYSGIILRHQASSVQQTHLPSKEEQLGGSLTGAVDVALALHQLFHTLQIQTCITTSPVAALQWKKAKQVAGVGCGVGRGDG